MTIHLRAEYYEGGLMGCDIHLRAEYYAPLETVRLVDGDLKVVPSTPENMQEVDENLKVVAATSLAWQPAEKLTPKEELEHNRFYLDNLDKYQEEWDAMPSLELAYEDRYYKGRWYWLFTLLAGVRGDAKYALWDDRGFPDDASDEVREDFVGWDCDAHTPSYQTLAELLEHDWRDLLTDKETGWFGGGYWLETLEKLKDLCVAKCDGDQTRVRIVYWFDN